MVGFNVALQLEVFGSVPSTRKGVKFSQYWTGYVGIAAKSFSFNTNPTR